MKSPICNPVSIQAHLEVFLLQQGIPSKRVIRIIDHMKSDKGVDSMKGRWEQSLTETMHPVVWAVLCDGAMLLNELFKEEMIKNN